MYAVKLISSVVGSNARPAHSRAVILLRTEALAQENTLYLRENPLAPMLYSSGVEYFDPDANTEVPWMDIGTILHFGSPDDGIPPLLADCKSLAAWRKAELFVRYGITCQVDITEARLQSGTVYHVFLRHNNGRPEDPSVLLGMV